VKFRDYYEILGVPRGAKPDEIKRAYRKAARKHHPDVAKPADRAAAEEEIKLVNEAYEVLRDPQKRARYDALGANWKAGDDFAPPNGGAPRGGGGQYADFDDFSDFFSSIFGDMGRRGGGGSHRQASRRRRVTTVRCGARARSRAMAEKLLSATAMTRRPGSQRATCSSTCRPQSVSFLCCLPCSAA